MSHQILTPQEIAHKIQRIAYQIFESNVDEKEIVVAGISGTGMEFALRISRVLEKITTAKIVLCEVQMDKKNPLKGVSTSIDKETFKHKSVVLVDDVLNSGSTLIYGVHHFLQVPLKQLKTAVLVNRNHKKFPVKADFKGISLSTSLQEHIEVVFGKGKEGVFLK